jgi:lambda family phage minor tail protein L
MSEVPKIASEVQKLNPSAVVELFELDTRNHVGGSILRFHAGTNALQDYVVWGGNEYAPFPIEAQGFEWRGSGTLPRPTVRVANVTGLLGAVVREMDDLIGSKVTRIRTFARYLDAVNFPSGNPLADPTAEFSRDVFFVNRKVSENKYMIEFELAPMLDVQGVKLPRRVAVANVCPWRYRSAECGYAGGPVADSNDLPTSDPTKDQCGKRLDSCKLRFPNARTTGLPFGGFPGVALVRY